MSPAPTSNKYPEQRMTVNVPAGQTWTRQTSALMVLNPREIPDCVSAIRGLGIDTCWVSYMPEIDAAAAINQAIQDSDYDRYIILADDTIPTRHALDAVLGLHDQGHDVVTGYCNLDSVMPLCNLTTNPLPEPPPGVHSYHLCATEEAKAHSGPITTTFAGLALTCMARHMWLSYPLRTTVYGGQMDYDLSYRLGQAGIPIVAPPDGFIQHVKERWNEPDRAAEKRLLLGVRPPAVTWTLAR